MKKPTAATGTVKMFHAKPLQDRLRAVLAIQDLAIKAGESGDYAMHRFQKIAAQELHDLLAEVTE